MAHDSLNQESAGTPTLSSIQPTNSFTHPAGVLSHTSPPFRILYRWGFRTNVVSAAMMAPVNEMYAGEDQSWQDVYASYGCSLDFDVSDDDG